MGLEIVMRALLLGAALSATTALAASPVAPAGRSGSSENVKRPLPRKNVPAQKQSRMEKTRLDVKDNEVGVPTDKTKVETEQAIPESIPAAEPPHVALRGVRG